MSTLSVQIPKTQQPFFSLAKCRIQPLSVLQTLLHWALVERHSLSFEKKTSLKWFIMSADPHFCTLVPITFSTHTLLISSHSLLVADRWTILSYPAWSVHSKLFCSYFARENIDHCLGTSSAQKVSVSADTAVALRQQQQHQQQQNEILESVSLMKNFGNGPSLQQHHQHHHQGQENQQMLQQQATTQQSVVSSIVGSSVQQQEAQQQVLVVNANAPTTTPATIPQEIATMSDNDLISFINPNAFDQGEYDQSRHKN